MSCLKKCVNFVLQQKKEQSALEDWKNKEKIAQDKLDDDSKGHEKLGSKENALKVKIEEAQSKITEMCSVPSIELIQKYQQQSQKTVSISFPGNFFWSNKRID